MVKGPKSIIKGGYDGDEFSYIAPLRRAGEHLVENGTSLKWAQRDTSITPVAQTPLAGSPGSWVNSPDAFDTSTGIVIANFSEASGSGESRLLKSTNGGASFSDQGVVSSSLAGDYSGDIAALDENRYFMSVHATGGVERIYRTTNGGSSWSLVHTLESSTLLHVSALGPETVVVTYVANPSGTNQLYKYAVTEDGGDTWATKQISSRGDAGRAAFSEIVAFDANNWAAVVAKLDGFTEKMHRATSSDGGETWSLAVMSSISLPSDNLFDIALEKTGESTAVLAMTTGSTNYIFTTSDKGVSWAQRLTRGVTSAGGITLAAGSASNVMAVYSRTGTDPYYLKSSDGGATWGSDVKITDWQTGQVLSLMAGDEDTYILMGKLNNNNATILKSTNFGSSWSTINTFAGNSCWVMGSLAGIPPATPTPRGVCSPSRDVGIIPFHDGTDIKVRRTSNRGTSYSTTQVTSSAGYGATCSKGSRSHIAYDGDGNGTLYVVSSSDQGLTWGSPVAIESTPDTAGGTFHIESNGEDTWIAYPSAAGADIHVKRSTDDAATFGSRLTAVSGTALSSPQIHVVDDQEAHVVYHEDGVGLRHVATTNAGSTWSSPVTINASAGKSHVLLRDSAGDLFSIHVDGTPDLVMYRSQDGGATWASDVTIEAGANDVPFGAFIDRGDIIYTQVISTASAVKSRLSTSFNSAFTLEKAIPNMNNALGGGMGSSDGKNIYLSFIKADKTLGIAQQREVLTIKGFADSTEEF